jgi:hypothetical protein
MGKQRTVRLDKFRQQIAESVIGNDNLVRVEFGPEDRDFINILIPDMLGQEETKGFNDRLEEARESDDAERNIALLILSGGPEDSAEEQLERWTAAGNDIAELAIIWGVERRRVSEALGNFRYRA